MFNRDLSRLFTGLVKAQELAKERFDITLLWIFDVVRNVSKDGFEIIDLAKSARDQGVSVAAIGLAGDESIGRTRDFAAAFSAARKLNFSTLAHAGETVGPDSIWETLEYLKPTRIGHGIRAVEDPVLLRELEKQQIPLELCPYSNVILGVYPKDNYPIAKLLDAGIPITLNSDDPGIFNRDLISNYRFAAECGLGEKELLMFAENSLTQRIF